MTPAVAAFRAGDDAAFAAIYERHRPAALALARRIVNGSAVDADDVVSDAFLKAFASLRTMQEPPANLGGWLMSVVRTTALDHLRAVRHHDPVDETAPAPGTTPDVVLRRAEFADTVADIKRLPEQQRVVLLATTAEDATYSDLAQRIGTSEGAVRNLLHRARTSMRLTRTAQQTPCAEIERRLASARARGVRPDELSRRHLWRCPRCTARRVTLSVGAAPLLAKGLLTVAVVGTTSYSGVRLIAEGPHHQAVIERADGTVERVSCAPGSRDQACMATRMDIAQWLDDWPGLDLKGARSGTIVQAQACRPGSACVSIDPAAPAPDVGSTIADDHVTTMTLRVGVHRGRRSLRRLEGARAATRVTRRPSGSFTVVTVERGARCSLRAGRCRRLDPDLARRLAVDPTSGPPGWAYVHQVNRAVFAG